MRARNSFFSLPFYFSCSFYGKTLRSCLRLRDTVFRGNGKRKEERKEATLRKELNFFASPPPSKPRKQVGLAGDGIAELFGKRKEEEGRRSFSNSADMEGGAWVGSSSFRFFARKNNLPVLQRSRQTELQQAQRFPSSIRRSNK